MHFRFIGLYTNGHTRVASCGVTFEGRAPSEVTDPDAIRRLNGNPEFIAASPLDHDGDGKPGGSLPRKRGRPRKDVE